MNRFIVLAALLACLGVPSSLEARGPKRYLNKESTADMSAMKTIFLGWVDMKPDDWKVHEYGSKEEWAAVINTLNRAFQQDCATTRLSGRTVTAANDQADENAAGQDLSIRFSDVRIDYNYYLLYLSIHFIDPKTKAEIAAIPVRGYYGNAWGFDGYLKAALAEVGRKIQVEITGTAPAK